MQIMQEQTQQHTADGDWAEARIAELEQSLRDEKSLRAEADGQREATARVRVLCGSKSWVGMRWVTRVEGITFLFGV